MFTIKPYFRITGKGFKGPEQDKLRHRKQCRNKKKHFRYLFLLREPSQNKRWGNTQTYPSNMLMNELELSYRCNSGWHCKKMVSCFVSKSIYYNSWFVQFFFLKISIKSSTTDMFSRLESFVRGILQKLYISLKETLIQCADWFTYFIKKKKTSVRSDRK